MNNEIVRMVSQKTGLDEAKAKQAVDAVASFLRNKLPAPIASQVDKVLASNGEGASKGMSGAGEVAKKVGGMFGGKKAR